MTAKNVHCGIDRRTFLQGIAAGSALPLASLSAAEPKGGKSCVVMAEREAFAAGAKSDKAEVKKAVEAMVMKLAGESSPQEAWRCFVSKGETVGLKFNGLFRNASTSPVVVWAVARGLVDAGHPQEKVIVFDWRERDYRTAGVKPFDDMPKVPFLTSDSAWDAEVSAGPVKTRLTKIITEKVDALITIPRLKHHVRAGVTISMKNHLGSIANPRDFHDHIQAIAELNALPPIAKKTRLSVCDAMIGIWDRGPQFAGSHFTWKAKTLLAAKDVVALDAVGADMLAKARKSKGRGAIRPNPVHVPHAAELGLGEADLSKIEVVKV